MYKLISLTKNHRIKLGTKLIGRNAKLIYYKSMYAFTCNYNPKTLFLKKTYSPP